MPFIALTVTIIIVIKKSSFLLFFVFMKFLILATWPYLIVSSILYTYL